MVVVESYPMIFRAATGVWGFCGVDVFRPAPDRLVVVLTEMQGNDGPSIAHAAADVWALVEARHAPDPGVTLVRVERWDHPTGTTHDLIDFSRSDDGAFSRPRWRRLGEGELADLLGLVNRL